MLNQPIQLNSKGMYPVVATTEECILLSPRSDKTMEAIEERRASPSKIWGSVLEIPLSKVNSISFKEASKNLKVKYLDEKDRERKRTLTFSSENAANNYGQFLAPHVGLAEHKQAEKKLWPILAGLGSLALCAFMTIMIASADDASAFESNAEGYSRSARQSRNGAEILKIIYNTLGPTGTIVLGSAIALGIIFYTYRRLQNPKMELEWKRQ